MTCDDFTLNPISDSETIDNLVRAVALLAREEDSKLKVNEDSLVYKGYGIAGILVGDLFKVYKIGDTSIKVFDLSVEGADTLLQWDVGQSEDTISMQEFQIDRLIDSLSIEQLAQMECELMFNMSRRGCLTDIHVKKSKLDFSVLKSAPHLNSVLRILLSSIRGISLKGFEVEGPSDLIGLCNRTALRFYRRMRCVVDVVFREAEKSDLKIVEMSNQIAVVFLQFYVSHMGDLIAKDSSAMIRLQGPDESTLIESLKLINREPNSPRYPVFIDGHVVRIDLKEIEY